MLRPSAIKIASRARVALSTQPSSIVGSQLSSNSNRRIFSTAPVDTNNEKPVLFDVVPKEDFGQYKEYSVIFTNRALNLMSDPFQKVMRDLNLLLKHTYNASKVAIIPG